MYNFWGKICRLKCLCMYETMSEIERDRGGPPSIILVVVVLVVVEEVSIYYLIIMKTVAFLFSSYSIFEGRSYMLLYAVCE